MKMKPLYFSSAGPRKINQDFVFFEEIGPGKFLLVIADGVGGNNGGETASRIATQSFVLAVKHGMNLRQAVVNAHLDVCNMAANNSSLHGMATTFSALIVDNKKIRGVHAGDSRVYLLRSNGLQQLTNDETEVATLLAQGSISKKEALHYPRKNILTNALGTSRDFHVQEFSIEIKPADRILLLTDGVYSVVGKRTIRDMSILNTDFSAFISSMEQITKKNEPSDNFSLLGIEVCAE